MTMNRVQVQAGLSMPEFLERYEPSFGHPQTLNVRAIG
jgi:hypothetical protein